MKANLLSATTLVAILLLLVPLQIHAEDYTYTNDNGAITITGYNGPGGDLAIPSTINDLPVTGIGDGAFEGQVSLTSVAIPNAVTNIGNYAFDSCSSLATVAIPDSVRSIGHEAFDFCTSLAQVEVPTSTTFIGHRAWGNCSSLAAITVDAANPAYSSLEGVLFDRNRATLIQYPGAKSGTYAIPGSVTYLETDAFRNCRNLTGVTIPNSVTSIGSWVFAFCTSLTNLTIPSSVTSVGPFEPFYACTSLPAINVDQGNPSFSSLDGVLFDKAQTSLLQCPGGKTGTLFIPPTVTSTIPSAFHYCFGVTTILVEASNPRYSGNDGVLLDKSQAFLYRCPGGKSGSYTIPGTVTSVLGEAFHMCPKLTRVTVPSSVNYLGTASFQYCSNLTGVYFEGPAPYPSQGPGTVGGVFSNSDNVTVYYLPGTTGWGPTFADRPTALWRPEVRIHDASFGVRSNQFGFHITWAEGRTVVVESCTNLADPAWSPVSTNTITGGSSYFSDPDWAQYPARFYRLRWP